MIKIVYLVAMVWNGGIGPSGVHSRLNTFSSSPLVVLSPMEQCEVYKELVLKDILTRFPFKPYYLECHGVTIPEARI